MKKAGFYCVFIFIFCSCSHKSSNNNVAPESDTVRLSVVQNPDHIVHTKTEIELLRPYSSKTQGIWGNMNYLENLRKYNSVGKVLELIKFDTEIKINSDMALIMRPQYMEPAELDSVKYILLDAGPDSLYVRSRNTGEKQLYIKFMSLPDTVLWNLYEDEKYSAISMIEWQWFQGKYNLTSDKADKKEVSFQIDGSVKGMYYDFYSFGIDVDGKDFIYLEKQGEEYSYFLIEYKSDNLFECYNIEDVEDWEYPFVKTTLAFKLQKVE